MCLIKLHKFPLLTFKSKKVYKVLIWYKRPGEDAHLITPYRYASVSLGMLLKNETPFYKGIDKKYISGEGVHAYRNKYTAIKDTCKDLIAQSEIEQKYVVALATIPPLTFYWLGTRGEIAATKMRIDKILKL